MFETRRLLVLIALLSVCSFDWSPRVAAEAPDAARTQLRALLTRTGTPGISAAVARDGKVVFSGGVGFADLEQQVPASSQTVYDIGSVSKVITAVAILQLVGDGKVGLDDDVRTYVPEFQDHGVRITLRHVLTHTSGIRHYRDNDFPGTPDNDNISPAMSWTDGLTIFARDPLLFEPGRFYFYSSYAVNLLQGVVERRSGRDFQTYLRERVWGPAAMTSAALDNPDEVVPHRARSYRLVNGHPLNAYYADLRYKFASGGMMASAEDLVRFCLAINHDRVLEPAMRRLMFSNQLKDVQGFRPDARPVALDFEQGMLWRLHRDAAGRRVAYHCGSVKSFNACVVDFFDEDLSAALFTNSWECCGWKDAEALAALFRK